jgi:peptidoglycan DL-endopeptidase CwlO
VTAATDSTMPDPLQPAPAGQNAPRTSNPLEEFIKPVADPNGSATAGWRSELLDFAKKFVNTPYKWGGNTPLGFDCSGFVQYVYSHFGVNLPRVSYQQAAYGARTTLANAKIGDLVAWDNSDRNAGADHIGFYAGVDDQGRPLVLNAPAPGGVVKIQPVWGNPWVVSMEGAL